MTDGPVVDVGGLSVVADALDVTFDEDVARLFAGQYVDVVERHFVRVPDDAPQLVAGQTTRILSVCLSVCMSGHTYTQDSRARFTKYLKIM